MDEVRYRLKEIIAALEERAKVMEFQRAHLPHRDAHGRGTYSGWVAATNADLAMLRALLEEFAVDELIEEDFSSLAEREAAL